MIAEGTSDELKDMIGGERIEVTLGDASQADAAVAALAEISSEEPKRADGVVSVPLDRERTSIADAVRRLDSAGVEVEDLAVRRPTLDDVFITLTGHAAEEASEEDEEADAMSHAISDTLVLAKRNLIRIVRAPDLLTAFTIQPIMFVLLFVYVFGGAIQVPPSFDSYADFLIPGIVVQNIAFGGFATALGLCGRPPARADRPLPLVADGALRGARRANDRRHRDEPALAGDRDRRRPASSALHSTRRSATSSSACS